FPSRILSEKPFALRAVGLFCLLLPDSERAPDRFVLREEALYIIRGVAIVVRQSLLLAGEYLAHDSIPTLHYLVIPTTVHYLGVGLGGEGRVGRAVPLLVSLSHVFLADAAGGGGEVTRRSLRRSPVSKGRRFTIFAVLSVTFRPPCFGLLAMEPVRRRCT
ncbi:MAG TPA: hypothetical protein VGH01_06375, partial [Jatrophihabitantaceae bacterium]